VDNMHKIPVIFIDDERFFLDSIRRSFKQIDQPWQPSFYAAPQEALAHICRLDECIVVTDWMMPGMDGIELSQQVKKAQERAAGYYYIIVLTGKNSRDSDAEALHAGADDILHKPFDRTTLTARIQAGVRILDYSKRLHLLNQQLEIISSTDALTGLHNRRKGRALLHNEVERCKRGKQDLCVVMADIDHFKQINDAYGHDVGDRVIKQAAKRLKTLVREYDQVVRWGGEEFLIIAPLTRKEEGMALTERIRSAFASEPFVLNDLDLSLRVTLSQGFVSYPAVKAFLSDIAAESSNSILETLIKFSDMALYSAKAAGRNKALYYQAPSAETTDSSTPRSEP
jgi:two-component system, cell cycle response regulator